MTEEEILDELRAIRMLLAIEKKNELEELIGEISRIQIEIIDRLEDSDWQSLSSSDISEKLGEPESTVREHRSILVDSGLLDKRGRGPATEYRKTSLAKTAEILGIL